MLSKIEILFLIFISTLSLSQEALISFFREVAGVRDFRVVGSLVFHVKGEDGKISETEISGEIMVRNLEDLYVKIEKPEVLSGLVFVYINDAKRLYSGFDGNIDMDVVYTDRNFIKDILASVIDVISSPFFSYSVRKDGDREVYRFFPIAKTFLHRVGIEPITVDTVFESDILRKIRITSVEGDEFVEIDIEEFEIGADVDEAFNSVTR